MKQLKVYESYFNAILDGRKTWEIRTSEHLIQRGDILELVEVNENGEPTGRTLERIAGYIDRPFEVYSAEQIAQHGLEIIGLELIQPKETEC